MKKLLFIICFFTSAASFAQTKEETIAYIDSLYKKTFTFGKITVTSVACDEIFFIKTFSDNDTTKTDLSVIKTLRLERHYDGSKWHIISVDQADDSKAEYVLGYIQSEPDAILLKEALEHLINILKKRNE